MNTMEVFIIIIPISKLEIESWKSRATTSLESTKKLARKKCIGHIDIHGNQMSNTIGLVVKRKPNTSV